MFESAEIGHKIDKQHHAKKVPQLREALVEAQYKLAQDLRRPVIVVVAGVECSGRGEVVNLLNEWMDPRHIQVHASRSPLEDERLRPPMWRFWQDLPPKGRIGMFFGSWYTDPIVARVAAKMKHAKWERSVERIIRFEKMLTDEGATLVKFWLHLSQSDLKKRIKKLSSRKESRWRVTDQDRNALRSYPKFKQVVESILTETSRAWAPWVIVESSQARYRNLTVGTVLLETLRNHLANHRSALSNTAAPLQPPIDQYNILDTLDMSQCLDRVTYKRELKRHQGRVFDLTHDPRFAKTSLVLVFEGNDAAGKGGAIRRLTRAVDVRAMKIHPISAPSDEELAQPYLWRFWRRIPRLGRIAIFDRSWYGRLLVERVEGFCSRDDWMRAYSEINEFEEELTEAGIVVVKFWLSISKDEQLRRFKEREKIPFKRFKITEDDWRNRDKWEAYAEAVGDMFDRTSTRRAPWTLVEANDKAFARVKVVKTVADQLEAKLAQLTS